MRALGRSQAVNHKIERLHLFADDLRRSALGFRAKCIAVQARGENIRGSGERVKRHGVVMSRGRGLIAVRFAFKKHAERFGFVSERRDNARRKSVSGRRADHEHVAWRTRRGLRAPAHRFGPALDVAPAPFRVSVHANEAARAALDELYWHQEPESLLMWCARSISFGVMPPALWVTSSIFTWLYAFDQSG